MKPEQAQEIINGVASGHSKFNIDHWNMMDDVATVWFDEMPVSDPRTVCKWFTDAGAKGASVGRNPLNDIWYVKFTVEETETDELQKYVELYRQASEHDTETLWFKVRTIRDAITAGADRDTLLAECGKESGDSRKQVAKFYAVAMVFPLEGHAMDIDYWTYEVCATAPGVDPNNDDTHEIALGWLQKAVWGREIKRGKKTIHAKHTARTLRRAIRAANGNGSTGKPKAEVVYKGEAWLDGKRFITEDDGTQYTVLSFMVKNVHYLDELQDYAITITRQQAAETASAGGESEVAA